MNFSTYIVPTRIVVTKKKKKKNVSNLFYSHYIRLDNAKYFLLLTGC